MKIAVYTCVTNNYELPREPKFMDNNVDYHLFSDQQLQLNDWNVHVINSEVLTEKGLARKIKILSHPLLHDYDVTVWTDGNFVQEKSIMNLIDAMEYDMLCTSHGNRDCAYLEATVCRNRGLDHPNTISDQITRYKQYGYPKNNGLAATGFLIRKNTDQIAKFNELWWHEVSEGSIRDQISFDFCAWKGKVEFNTIGFDEIGKWFHRFQHAK